MKIKFSKKFGKNYDKAPEKIRKAFHKRLNIFLNNPQDKILRNHVLKGTMYGYRSINVTGDWRALYSEQQQNGKEIIVFEMLGTHSQLYQ
jgi:addiction module RelE/StbE family toxin